MRHRVRSDPTPDPAPRWQAVAAVLACRRDGRMAAAPVALFDRATTARAATTGAYRQWTVAAGAVAAGQAQLADVQARTRALTGESTQARRVADSFDATGTLRSSWFLGGDLLIVYPKNGYSAAEGAGYGARVLLGGLIALCVHVVLQGGSAVLGLGAAVTGDANSLAYCAIAILAGMFSDRVAAWLPPRRRVPRDGRRRGGRVTKVPLRSYGTRAAGLRLSDEDA